MSPSAQPVKPGQGPHSPAPIPFLHDSSFPPLPSFPREKAVKGRARTPPEVLIPLFPPSPPPLDKLLQDGDRPQSDRRQGPPAQASPSQHIGGEMPARYEPPFLSIFSSVSFVFYIFNSIGPPAQGETNRCADRLIYFPFFFQEGIEGAGSPLNLSFPSFSFAKG